MSRNTKYQFVYVGLKQMLAELQDGERLPSFNSLCSRYDISQATLNSALDLLEKDGLIRRVPKVGVYSAKSQAARREKKITLLMPGEHEPLFAAVISACCRFCRAHHIQLSLEFSDLDPDVECGFWTGFCTMRVVTGSCFCRCSRSLKHGNPWRH